MAPCLAAATPQNKYPVGEVRVAGRGALEILKILGAKRVDGTTDRQLDSYARAFTRTDRNRDGRHSKEEYIKNGRYMNTQAREGIFGAADNNADNFVSKLEYILNRTITDEAKAIVQRSDADKNGKVTRAEFVKGSAVEDKKLAGAVYDALDTTGDGVITFPEYLRVWGVWARPNFKAQEAALANRLTKLNENGKKNGGPPSVEQMFNIMDRNKDGKLTKAEFRGPTHIFTSADKDKNGMVTRAEMEASRGRTGRGAPNLGSRRRGPGRARTTFTKPHALDPALVKRGCNLVVSKNGREVPPQGRPIQEGYRLIRPDQPVEGHNRRAYAEVFSIMAPIRDALIYRLETTSPTKWKKLTAILDKNHIKIRQWLKGPTPRDNYYSSQGIFEHLRSTYAGKIPAGSVPGNTYARRDYHAMMKYLEETELELKFRTFSADFDFTNPAGVNSRPQPVKDLIR